MREISRRRLISVLALAGALSACSREPELVSDTSTPKGTLENFFFRQVSIDLDKVKEANEEFSEIVSGTMSEGSTLYENLKKINEEDLDRILNAFSKSDRSFELYKISELEKFEKTFLAISSAMAAVNLSGAMGSEGEILIDETLIDEEGSKVSFDSSGVSLSSTSATKEEMADLVSRIFPETIHLLLTDDQWRIDGRSFVDETVKKLD